MDTYLLRWRRKNPQRLKVPLFFSASAISGVAFFSERTSTSSFGVKEALLKWFVKSYRFTSALYICCKRSFTTDNIPSFEEKKMSLNSGFCVETSSPDLMWNYLTCHMWTPPNWVISFTTTLALWQQWRYVQKTKKRWREQMRFWKQLYTNLRCITLSERHNVS